MKVEKPKDEREWAAYRCALSCRIGRDVLDGNKHTPDGFSRLEYALYNLLHAIEELASIQSKGNQ